MEVSLPFYTDRLDFGGAGVVVFVFYTLPNYPLPVLSESEYNDFTCPPNQWIMYIIVNIDFDFYIWLEYKTINNWYITLAFIGWTLIILKIQSALQPKNSLRGYRNVSAVKSALLVPSTHTWELTITSAQWVQHPLLASLGSLTHSIYTYAHKLNVNL